MNELDLHYPDSSCPFCTIADAFPFAGAPATEDAVLASTLSSSTLNPKVSSPPSQQQKSKDYKSKYQSHIPKEEDADPEKTQPASFVVLASEYVLAFLDILPMTGGHLLVATRGHRRTVGEMEEVESRELGFWLPVLARVVSRVVGVSDYNIVQNNGARAAQVVPHVHFHIIPRPESLPEIKSKSWTMFGRGPRDELDDDEGAQLAAKMREALREEVEKLEESRKPESKL